MKRADVLIAGVGGQGIILASEIMALAAMKEGLDVKKAEVHGMSQRGGSVVSTLRYAEKIHSPLIKSGTADILLGFEKLEAYRMAPAVRPDGVIIVNDQEIYPITVASGKAKYPEDLYEKLSATGRKIIKIDAYKIAQELGELRAVNVVILGALASQLDLAKESWIEAIKERVPAKAMEVNLQAFERGWQVGKSGVQKK